MVDSIPVPAVPHARGWDIAFTRISQEALPEVDACLREMTLRFLAVGLTCDEHVRQTPRGLSTFLAVAGGRGLLLIVDVTLIDGMAVARHRGAALNMRLLDACGEVVSDCTPATEPGAPIYRSSAHEVIAAADLARCTNTMFVTAAARFDLVLPIGHMISM